MVPDPFQIHRSGFDLVGLEECVRMSGYALFETLGQGITTPLVNKRESHACGVLWWYLIRLAT